MRRDGEIRRWQEYQSQTAHNKPRALLIQALPYVQEKNAALDLGAGALYDAQYLLNSGFKEVIAVDMTPQFRELDTPEGARLTYVESSFEQYQFEPNYFDLLSSQYALPFTGQTEFPRIWRDALASLKKNGIFCGQLFGERDEWSHTGSILIHSKEEILTLAGNSQILFLEEVERDSPTAGGTLKHWHYFDLILKKD